MKRRSKGTLDLFPPPPAPTREALGEGAALLRGFALPYASDALEAVRGIALDAPFRNMVTPGGFIMSVALTNCGTYGWVSDRRGYRYSKIDPETEKLWPEMPEVFTRLAYEAANEAGFRHFSPDACLINRYLPGTRLTLHQDTNELDYTQPIVSVSLGIPATFLWGGHQRTDKTMKVPLGHGDVVVWGGPDRMRYHGISPIKEALHPEVGAVRINFTFRRAG